MPSRSAASTSCRVPRISSSSWDRRAPTPSTAPPSCARRRSPTRRSSRWTRRRAGDFGHAHDAISRNCARRADCVCARPPKAGGWVTFRRLCAPRDATQIAPARPLSRRRPLAAAPSAAAAHTSPPQRAANNNDSRNSLHPPTTPSSSPRCTTAHARLWRRAPIVGNTSCDRCTWAYIASAPGVGTTSARRARSRAARRAQRVDHRRPRAGDRVLHGAHAAAVGRARRLQRARRRRITCGSRRSARRGGDADRRTPRRDRRGRRLRREGAGPPRGELVSALS